MIYEKAEWVENLVQHLNRFTITANEDRTLEIYDFQLSDSTINIKSFGAVGDGITDDTKAIQAAFTAAKGKRIEIPSNFNCLITEQIVLPDDIIINSKGQFTCSGDEDYWFYADKPTRVIIENFKAELTTAFVSRTLLNRVLVCNTPIYFEVKKAEIIGSSTAIHCLYGENFICGDIILRNVLGVEAQYGYGINSSAKRTTIQSLTVLNDDAANGRHAIYINGDIWDTVLINNVFVKNWNKNPINIANTDSSMRCNMYIENATFVNANLAPTDVNTGCIHGIAGNPSALKLHVESLYVRNIGGPALSTADGCDDLYLGSLYAVELPKAPNANTYLVYIRSGINKQIKKVFCSGLNKNWLAGIYLRDTSAVIDDVYIGGTEGSEAVRLNNSNVILGNIQTEIIDKIYSTASTVKYK